MYSKIPLLEMRLLLSQNVFSEAYDEEKEKLTLEQYMTWLRNSF